MSSRLKVASMTAASAPLLHALADLRCGLAQLFTSQLPVTNHTVGYGVFPRQSEPLHAVPW